MIQTPLFSTADQAWRALCREVLVMGKDVSPRDQGTTEALGLRASFDMHFPVVTPKARGLSYTGMSAEALWITSGSDRLAEIEPWLPAMRRFSDNGEHLWGAYGPRILDQLDTVVERLARDRDTRQAVISTWRPNPPPFTKDCPCTLTFHFVVREDRLNVFVNMRSSDLFLGFPYDAFSFTMVAVLVATTLNELLSRRGDTTVSLGRLYYGADSCHIYHRDADRLAASLADANRRYDALPDHLVHRGAFGWSRLQESLRLIRDGRTEPISTDYGWSFLPIDSDPTD